MQETNKMKQSEPKHIMVPSSDFYMTNNPTPMLDVTSPRGSLVGTGHKNKYPEGILYPPVAKYLESEPDIANQKRLLSGLLKRLISGLSLPGRYVCTRI